MHYTGEIYRPPNEGNTPLLQVTTGCSWNKCTFCNMYKTPFNTSKKEEIEEDLIELKKYLERQQKYYPEKTTKIYLVNGDPFVYSTEKLLNISDLIHKYLPDIETIACYASIRNIKNKSPDDLKKLKQAGYNLLYIGIETGYNPALKFMNKGYTNNDEYTQLQKLENAGIQYGALLMSGIAGHGHYKENVEATTKLLNTIQPCLIWYTATSVVPDTPLFKLRNEGEFEEVTEREMIEEELYFLDNLDMEDDVIFYGNHPYNLIPVGGPLSDKDNMIKHIERNLENLENTKPDLLNSKFNTHPSKINNYKHF